MMKLRVLRVLALVALAGGCASSTDPTPEQTTGGPPALTVAAVIKQVGAPGESLPACPLPYDPATSAKSAGFSTTSVKAQPPASVTTSETAGAGSFLATIAPAVSVECDYSLGAATIHTRLLVTGKTGAAINGLLPQLAAWSESTLSTLADSFVKPALAAPVGKATLVPNGRAALVKLKVTDGEGALVVAVDAAAKLTAGQLTAFTTALAAQV